MNPQDCSETSYKAPMRYCPTKMYVRKIPTGKRDAEKYFEQKLDSGQQLLDSEVIGAAEISKLLLNVSLIPK